MARDIEYVIIYSCIHTVGTLNLNCMFLMRQESLVQLVLQILHPAPIICAVSCQTLEGDFFKGGGGGGGGTQQYNETKSHVTPSSFLMK